MKKIILTFIGLFIIGFVYGQSDCNALIQENESLKAQLGIKPNEEVLIKGIDEEIKINIIDCIGSSDQQTVTINFVISHSLVHQNICINMSSNDAKAYDDQGNEFLAKSATIGSKSTTYNYACNKIPTGVPVKASITFRNVLPTNEHLNFATILFGYKNEDGGSSYVKNNLEIRNLKINW